jgi:hypothetical protein
VTGPRILYNPNDHDHVQESSNRAYSSGSQNVFGSRRTALFILASDLVVPLESKEKTRITAAEVI